MKREGDGSSFRYFGGTCEAWDRFFASAQQDIDSGARKKATQLYGASGGKSWYERTRIRQQWGKVMAFGKQART